MMHKRYNGPAALATAAPAVARKLSFSLLALLALGGPGCGGGSFSNGIYDDGMVRYQVGRLGPGWEPVELKGNDLAFNHGTLGTLSINSTCTDYEDVPEEALLNHLLFGMRERHFRSEETVTLDGRGALHAIVDLQLDGVPVTLEVYLVKKDGCVYDMTLISSRAMFERARADLTRLIAGFHVLHTNLN